MRLAVKWMRALVLLGMTVTAYAGSLEFRIEGKLVKSISQAELESVVPVMALPVKNPINRMEMVYEGVPLLPLMQNIFGEELKRYDAVQFLAGDGFEPVLPLATMEKHFGLIAWRDLGAEGLQVLSDPEGNSVTPGNFFVVWENIKDAETNRDAWVSWPWQLSTVVLTRLETVYRESAPPIGSGSDVRNGYAHFQQYCIKCHSVNGAGGNTGPELNFPANVTEYWQRNWLRAYISDPESVRHGGKMTPFPVTGPQRYAMVDEIVRYLEVMARNKKKPVEDEPVTPIPSTASPVKRDKP